MPTTPLSLALDWAPQRVQAQAARPEEEFFIFKVGELCVAVPSRDVRAVFRMGPLTPLPRSPAFLLGVVGYRGEVLPLVDLLRFLQQGETRPTPRHRLFISANAGQTVAFLADQIIGLRRVFTADKLPPPAGGSLSHEFLTGLVQTNDLGTLALVDLARVVHSARQRVVAR